MCCAERGKDVESARCRNRSRACTSKEIAVARLVERTSSDIDLVKRFVSTKVVSHPWGALSLKDCRSGWADFPAVHSVSLSLEI
jgi:hypothetical protein